MQTEDWTGRKIDARKPTEKEWRRDEESDETRKVKGKDRKYETLFTYLWLKILWVRAIAWNSELFLNFDVFYTA